MSDVAVRMHAPDPVSWSDAYGYYDRKDQSLELADDGNDTKNKDKKRQYVVFNNILNGLSYIFSPLVGIARIIANLVIRHNDVGSDIKREFYNAQIIRGVFEIFGGGYLLWIVDIIFSTPKVRDHLSD